jgi:hypothetical protein
MEDIELGVLQYPTMATDRSHILLLAVEIVESLVQHVVLFLY